MVGLCELVKGAGAGSSVLTDELFLLSSGFLIGDGDGSLFPKELLLPLLLLRLGDLTGTCAAFVTVAVFTTVVELGALVPTTGEGDGVVFRVEKFVLAGVDDDIGVLNA